MLVVLFGLASCEENEYYLSPEVAIQVPDNGLSVELGGTLEIKADVTNGGENPHYQWYVNDIKVSTSPVLRFRATEPGNNTVKLTVTNGDGSSSDAATVLVARAALEASISVVGDRSTTIQYQDSIILRGLVYSREDYEVEWIREGERVSKEFYYVFKAEKEGTHTLTFKVLDKNGNYVTDDIDITVEVPQLAVTIEEPKNGFRCPQGQTLMLHGEANRVNNVQYEWIVGGQVVCTEPDFEFKGTELNDVEVALRVVDPTQTATAVKTITVHHPYLYGTILVGKYDMHFVDYLGNLTQNIFTAANPDLASKEVSFQYPYSVAYDDTRIVTLTNRSFKFEQKVLKTLLKFDFIDLKMLTRQKSLTLTLPFECNNSFSDCMIAIRRDKFYFNISSRDEGVSGVYEIDINSGEYKKIWDAGTIECEKMFRNKDILYIFGSKKMTAIDLATGETIYNNAIANLNRMNLDGTTAIMDDVLITTESTTSKFLYFFDLTAGKRTSKSFKVDSPRLTMDELITDGKDLYTCADGYVGKVDLEAKQIEYLGDVTVCDVFKTGTFNEGNQNLFVTSTGQFIVRNTVSNRIDNIAVFNDTDWKNPASSFTTKSTERIKAFIPRK